MSPKDLSRREALKGAGVGATVVAGTAIAGLARADSPEASVSALGLSDKAADEERERGLFDGRHTLAVNAMIKLGAAGPFEINVKLREAFEQDGLRRLRPQRFTTNPLSPGMFILESVKIDGVECIHHGVIDAWQWNANAVGEHLDLHAMTADSEIQVKGEYTGVIPSPLPDEGLYTFCLSMTGPVEVNESLAAKG